MPQDEQFEGGSLEKADKSLYIIVSPNSFAYNPARINVGSIGYQNEWKNVIITSNLGFRKIVKKWPRIVMLQLY